MSLVKFNTASLTQYESITPDEHTFYRVDISEDSLPDVYLGVVKLNQEEEILALIKQVEELQEIVDDLENPFYLLDNYTCRQVQEIVDKGEAENYWSIGDTTNDIPLNGTVGICEFDNESYKAMIIGFNHNSELETNDCYSMTLQFGQNDDRINIAFIDDSYSATGSTDAFRMNTSNTNSGGWESSYMRNTICPQFLEVLPNSLQNVIGTTTKYTDNTGKATGSVESNVTATEDKIFLLAGLEIFSSDSNVNSYEADYQERYTWYVENDLDNVRIRYRHSIPSSTSNWWLRSPLLNGSYNFCRVNATGSSSTNSANVSYGFAPCFTIAGSSPIVHIILQDSETQNILQDSETNAILEVYN